MSDPNLDFVQPTNPITTLELCSSASPTLDIIEWEPDGRSIEEPPFDDVVFEIDITVV